MQYRPVIVTIHAAVNGRMGELPMARIECPAPEGANALVVKALRDIADVMENDPETFEPEISESRVSAYEIIRKACEGTL